MDVLLVFSIAVGLAMDCLAVSVSAGSCREEIDYRLMFTLALLCGVFQGGMLFLGWQLGSGMAQVIHVLGPWFSSLLLIAIGCKMLYDAFWAKHERQPDYYKFRILLLLALATSVDALVTGFSLAFLKGNLIWSTMIVGLMSFLFSLAGFIAGWKSRELLGKRAEILGGLILIAIAGKILYEHLIQG